MKNVFYNNIYDPQEEESTGPTSSSGKSDNEQLEASEKKSLTSFFETMGFKKKSANKKLSGQNSSSEGPHSSSGTEGSGKSEQHKWTDLQKRFFEKPKCMLAPKTTEIPLPI